MIREAFLVCLITSLASATVFAISTPTSLPTDADRALDRLADRSIAKPDVAIDAHLLSAMLDRLLPDTVGMHETRKQSPSVDALMLKLVDNHPAARDAAARELMQAGVRGWSKLRQAADGPDPELAVRARDVLDFWRGTRVNFPLSYVEGFRRYLWTVGKDRACLETLARRMLVSFDCGMPESNRWTVLRWSLYTLAREADTDCLDLLSPLLDHEDIDVAFFVYQEIIASRENKPLPSSFADMSSSQKVKLALLTHRLTARDISPKVTDALRQILRNGPDELRFDAAKWLADKEPDAIDYMLQLAKQFDDPQARDAVVQLGARKVEIRRLLPLLSSPNPEIRRAVAEIIGGAE